jgi:DNA-binding CsgD family transcriptional regulator
VRIDPVVKAGRRGFPRLTGSMSIEARRRRASFRRSKSLWRSAKRNLLAHPWREWRAGDIYGDVQCVGERLESPRVVCLRDLQMIGHFVHDRAVHVAGLGPSLPKQPPSEREVQCLEALSTGRTPKQIAEDLGISESAVRLYLHSIRRKLDCATIAQAVAVAISLNVIGS